MRRETPSGGIIWLTVILMATAAGVYFLRRPRPQGAPSPIISSRLLSREQASSLLFKAFQANNSQPYTAITDAEVLSAGHWYHSDARITKAPGDMTLHYLSGANSGLECGYHKNWLWRKPAAAPGIIPYAKLNDEAGKEEEAGIQLLLHNYQVTENGTGEINQRPADILDVVPRHPMDNARGPAKRIWVDQETHIPLRIETFNYQMKLVMRSSLSDLQLLATPSPDSFISDAMIQTAVSQTPWTVYEMGDDFNEVGRIAGVFPPLPGYVPTGFMRERVGLHRCSSQSDSCYAAFSRYSDGLNTLTLFVLAASCARRMQLDNPPAEEQTYVFGSGAMSSRRTKAGSVFIVADIPPAELTRILNSIEIRPYSMPGELNGNANQTSN